MQDAKAYCQSQYSDLAAIHDQASNGYIRQLCQQQIQAEGGVNGQSASGDSCWIGANDIDTGATQVWSDVRTHESFRLCALLPI